MDDTDVTETPDWRWPEYWEEEPKFWARIRQEVIEEQSDHMFDGWGEEQ